jgi:hypothetical protein
MDEIKQLIGKARKKAELATWKLLDIDLTGKYADDILFEAWDQLQTAAKLVDEARRRLKSGAA